MIYGEDNDELITTDWGYDDKGRIVYGTLYPDNYVTLDDGTVAQVTADQAGLIRADKSRHIDAGKLFRLRDSEEDDTRPQPVEGCLTIYRYPEQKTEE